MLLFDFTDAEQARLFHPIDDRVMGGVSASGLGTEGDHAVFSGEVSFENFGGFASVRSAPGSWDLSGMEGVELLVLGDGKTYKFSITTDPRYDSVVYRARFQPPGGRWTSVRIPFTDFTPTFRGEAVPGVPDLDPSSIDTFGFLISDRQEGAFRLLLKTVKAY
ncbi:MAG: CIA30 family protein [bacterium]|nr:MAG: CIA30 family protein [bacterium]